MTTLGLGNKAVNFYEGKLEQSQDNFVSGHPRELLKKTHILKAEVREPLGSQQ